MNSLKESSSALCCFYPLSQGFLASVQLGNLLLLSVRLIISCWSLLVDCCTEIWSPRFLWPFGSCEFFMLCYLLFLCSLLAEFDPFASCRLVYYSYSERKGNPVRLLLLLVVACWWVIHDVKVLFCRFIVHLLVICGSVLFSRWLTAKLQLPLHMSSFHMIYCDIPVNSIGKCMSEFVIRSRDNLLMLVKGFNWTLLCCLPLLYLFPVKGQLIYISNCTLTV